MGKPLCVVVGSGPGLGISLVQRFHEGGFKVAAVSRDRGRCEQLASAVGPPSEVKGYGADAGVPEDLCEALRKAADWAGAPPSVAIYNAAALSPGSASRLTPSFLDDLKVTLGGGVTLATFVADAMREAGKGTILFTGGGLSLEPHPDWAALGMGKAALRNYAGSLHRELRESGVLACIVTICGIIKPGTDFDPDRIADIYWQIHRSPSAAWKEEVVYMPGGDRLYNFAE